MVGLDFPPGEESQVDYGGSAGGSFWASGGLGQTGHYTALRALHYEMWELMQSYGCGFQSLRENFDTTTAAGKMVLFIVQWLISTSLKEKWRPQKVFSKETRGACYC